MRKIIRKLFSPTALAIFILLLEVGAVVFGIIFIQFILPDDKRMVAGIITNSYRFIALTVELLIYFLVIRKDENPEFKIPWIACLILLPLLTAFFYLIFANHGLRPKDKKFTPKIKKIIDEKFYQDDDERNEFKSDVDKEFQGIFKFLKTTTGLHSTRGNRITYYKNGEEFFPDFMKHLKKAEHFIFLEFFIITIGKEWNEIEKILLEKHKQGVEIRLIYDDMGCFGTLPGGYDKKLRKIGIKCYRFNKFTPLLSGIYNNRDHRKIAVIDHKFAFTGGMNLADEYANEELRFGYWKDTMVKIEGPGIANTIATFLQNYDLTTKTLSDYDKYLDDEYPYFEDEGYTFFFGDGPKIGDHIPIGEINYINLINAAQKSIYISTPYLILPYTIQQALRIAAQRGVEIKLFVPGTPDKKLVYWMAKCDFAQLTKYGIRIYTYTPGFNHEKQVVVDNKLAFCGTINFDFRSLVHHYECGVTLYKVPCIKEMYEDFLEMEKISLEVSPNYKIGPVKYVIATTIKVFRTLL